MTDLTPERRAENMRLREAATPGPWQIWDGPAYVGGGHDLCIGAGKEWVVNMDARYGPNREERLAHKPCGEDIDCPICTFSDEISAEQRATADYIVAACNDLPLYEAALAEREKEIERLKAELAEANSPIGDGDNYP